MGASEPCGGRDADRERADGTDLGAVCAAGRQSATTGLRPELGPAAGAATLRQCPEACEVGATTCSATLRARVHRGAVCVQRPCRLAVLGLSQAPLRVCWRRTRLRSSCRRASRASRALLSPPLPTPADRPPPSGAEVSLGACSLARWCRSGPTSGTARCSRRRSLSLSRSRSRSLLRSWSLRLSRSLSLLRSWPLSLLRSLLLSRSLPLSRPRCRSPSPSRPPSRPRPPRFGSVSRRRRCCCPSSPSSCHAVFASALPFFCPF